MYIPSIIFLCVVEGGGSKKLLLICTKVCKWYEDLFLEYRFALIDRKPINNVKNGAL